VNGLALARLLQLASQTLPIGGYSHSHGLESAVHHGVVSDESSALRFIADVFEFSLRTFELPLLLALHTAWSIDCPGAVVALNEESLATRETAELRAASAQMGYSMRALLKVLPDIPRRTLELLDSMPEPGFPCAWSAAAAAWGIDARESAIAYAWSWAENQVLAALKAVPLGQSAGQRMLQALGTTIALALERALPKVRLSEPAASETALSGHAPSTAGLSEPGLSEAGLSEAGLWPGLSERELSERELSATGLGEDAWPEHLLALRLAAASNFTPALAILSARHETQYSRLFRS
jgi:urease accessory protein